MPLDLLSNDSSSNTGMSVIFSTIQISLENITQKILFRFDTAVSIGGRPLCNLQFADDIDLMRTIEGELQQLTERLETTAA